MTRIFCDANVLFAAAISPDGRSSVLFALAREHGHELAVSAHVVEEARRNVVARYPDAGARLTELVRMARQVPEAPRPLVVWARRQGLDDNDAPVLAAAVHAEAGVLVTGDRTHFGHLFGTVLRGVEVSTLRDAVERMVRP